MFNLGDYNTEHPKQQSVTCRLQDSVAELEAKVAAQKTELKNCREEERKARQQVETLSLQLTDRYMRSMCRNGTQRANHEMSMRQH